MRILFLSEQFPYPLHDGGNLRTFHVLAALAKVHQVTLMAHAPETAEAQTTFPLDCDVITIRKPRVPQRIANALLQGSRLHGSLFIAKNWSASLLQRASSEIQHGQYHAVHFNHLDTACFALVRNWRLLKVFDTHNCLSNMAHQAAQSASGWWRPRIFSYEANRLQAVESKVCGRMDLNFVCSEVDSQMFQGMSSQTVYKVAANGVDCQYFQPQSEAREESGSLVFTGAMNYFPNEQAMEYFCRNVFPEIETRGVKMRIVGRRPTPPVRALHDGRRVFVTGEVNDVRPFVHRSQLFVVPLQHGSGTRLKILEAFAMGKAVVSTSRGAEGIPVTDGKELLLADSPIHFARCVDELLADPIRRRELGSNARKFVVAHFDWSRIQQTIREGYAAIEPS